jgi:DNA replication protein DnaC
VIVEGATGIGKSFLASALCTAACILSYSVRYLHTARFLLTLHHAKQDGSYLQYLRSLSKIDVLILDDWMLDPIQISAAQDLLEVFNDRFGRSTTIISSQVPISDWHARFPDPTVADAILDRSIHNAYQISFQGDSQRKIRGFRAISRI